MAKDTEQLLDCILDTLEQGDTQKLKQELAECHSADIQDFAPSLPIVFASGGAMAAAILAATVLGLSLPFLFYKLGGDPAVSSGPVVTTANDAISVLIFMSIVAFVAIA